MLFGFSGTPVGVGARRGPEVEKIAAPCFARAENIDVGERAATPRADLWCAHFVETSGLLRMNAPPAWAGGAHSYRPLMMPALMEFADSALPVSDGSKSCVCGFRVTSFRPRRNCNSLGEDMLGLLLGRETRCVHAIRVDGLAICAQPNSVGFRISKRHTAGGRNQASAKRRARYLATEAAT